MTRTSAHEYMPGCEYHYHRSSRGRQCGLHGGSPPPLLKVTQTVRAMMLRFMPGCASHPRGRDAGALTVRCSECLDVWPVECPQENCPARGWPHGLAQGGAVVELRADVVFEPFELVDEGGLVGAEVGGGGFDRGEGHGGLETLEAVPAVEAAFDGPADVAGNVVAQLGKHFGAAVHPGWAGGHVVAAGGGDDGHVLDAEFGGDVGVGTAAGEVLLAQPGRVDRGGIKRASHGDPVLAGALGEEFAGEPGLGLQLPERLPGLDIFALEELAGKDAAGTVLPLPHDRRGGFAPLPRWPGDLFERQPDVAAAGAQPLSHGADGQPFGDGKLADGLQVDVVRIAARQG